MDAERPRNSRAKRGSPPGGENMRTHAPVPLVASDLDRAQAPRKQEFPKRFCSQGSHAPARPFAQRDITISWMNSLTNRVLRMDRNRLARSFRAMVGTILRLPGPIELVALDPARVPKRSAMPSPIALRPSAILPRLCVGVAWPIRAAVLFVSNSDWGCADKSTQPQPLI